MAPLPFRRTRSVLLPTLLVSGALAGLVAGPLLAQERLPNGRLLTLGVTFGLEASDNPELEENGESRIDGITRFSLGLVDATPTQRLEFGTGFGLRVSSGDSQTDSVEFIDPDLNVSYNREGRNARLSLGASLRRSEVSALTPLDLILGDTFLPEDLDDLLDRDVTSEATRLGFSADATLETRLNSPFGITYSLGVTGVRYNDDSGAFDDETRATAGLGLRFDLTETIRADVDLGYTAYDEDDDDGESRDAARLNFGISQRRATSTVGTRLGFVSDGTGLRSTLALTGGLERPTGSLNGEIGTTLVEGGDLALTGSVRTAIAFPTGELNFGLARRVTQSEDDATGDLDSIALTTLSAGYNRQVTRDWRLGIDTSYIITEGLDDEGTDSFGQVGVDVSRALTKDWGLTMGVSHRFETDADGPDTSANIVSLSLSRSVRLPF